MEQKNQIIEEAIKLFKESGVKFTMDELSRGLGISKKTIYKYYTDKEELLCDMVEYVFDRIKRAEAESYALELSTADRIRGVLGAFPEILEGFDYNELSENSQKYPKAAALISKRLSGGWERTRELLNQGMEEGIVRNVNLDIFQLMYEASMEKFLFTDSLKKMHVNNKSALMTMVDIMLEGVLV